MQPRAVPQHIRPTFPVHWKVDTDFAAADALSSLREDIVPSESSYNIIPVEHTSELNIATSSHATSAVTEL